LLYQSETIVIRDVTAPACCRFCGAPLALDHAATCDRYRATLAGIVAQDEAAEAQGAPLPVRVVRFTAGTLRHGTRDGARSLCGVSLTRIAEFVLGVPVARDARPDDLAPARVVSCRFCLDALAAG
jgi:hypothetical protein